MSRSVGVAFPSPPPSYDPANEAQFRLTVQRALQDVAALAPEPIAVDWTAGYATYDARYAAINHNHDDRYALIEHQHALNGSDLTGQLPVSKLAPGTNGYILTMVGGVPAWAAAPAGGATSFSELTGQILDSQVPLSAVKQHEASLAIAFSQLTGPGEVPPERGGTGLSLTSIEPDGLLRWTGTAFAVENLTGTGYLRRNSDGSLSVQQAIPNSVETPTGADYFYQSRAGGGHGWSQFKGPSASGFIAIDEGKPLVGYLNRDGDGIPAADFGNVAWQYISNKPVYATRWPTLAEIGAAAADHGHNLGDSNITGNLPPARGGTGINPSIEPNGLLRWTGSEFVVEAYPHLSSGYLYWSSGGGFSLASSIPGTITSPSASDAQRFYQATGAGSHQWSQFKMPPANGFIPNMTVGRPLVVIDEVDPEVGFGNVEWAYIASKPAYATRWPTVAEVTGLQTALDGKANASTAWQRGLNGPALNGASYDLNDASGFHAFYANTNATNKPEDRNSNIIGFGLANYTTQLAARGSWFYIRQQEAGEWGPWRQIAEQEWADGRFVSLTGSYSNPSWLTALAVSKLTGPGEVPPERGGTGINPSVEPNGLLRWTGSAFVVEAYPHNSSGYLYWSSGGGFTLASSVPGTITSPSASDARRFYQATGAGSHQWSQFKMPPANGFIPNMTTGRPLVVIDEVDPEVGFGDVQWAYIANKPAYATRWPTIAEVTGLQAALDAKASIVSPTFTGTVTMTGMLYLSSQQIYGGFGAETTAGVKDWNDVSNARSGNGFTLLYGSETGGDTALNGPGPARYFHPFTFEYSSKDGSGNLTQFAIPYGGHNHAITDTVWMRGRNGGVWNAWRAFAMQDWVSANFAAASHTHAASQITAGTFGAGIFTFQNGVRIGAGALTSEGQLAIRHASPYISFHNTDADGTRWGYLQINGSHAIFLNANATPMRFHNNGGDRLRIEANGNVGIGYTSNQGHKLAVNGTAYIAGALTSGSAITATGAVTAAGFFDTTVP